MHYTTVILSTLLIFSGAFAKDLAHMKPATPPTELARHPEKATLVIHVNASFHLFKSTMWWFIDREFRGESRGTGYFVTHVDPGTHWIFRALDNKKIYNTARMTFEAGKLYFILSKSVPGGSILLSQTPDEFTAFIKEYNPAFYTFTPIEDKIPTVKEKRFVKAMEEFNEEVEEDPAKHEDMLNYVGF